MFQVATVPLLPPHANTLYQIFNHFYSLPCFVFHMYFDSAPCGRSLIESKYRSYARALSISRRNHFTSIGGVRWSSCEITQRANPNLQGSKPKSCTLASGKVSATRHCERCRPRRGDWDTLPNWLESYLLRTGLDHLRSN